ncbi:tetratricopeptide repeat protein [Aliiglaciecola litoralis]|uniref:Tetratricopeptide repeat protein n=1 Tax=Aliiglaciecola litoralis TaxID=582857 RepID=A0ABN1LFV2_9ALTE
MKSISLIRLVAVFTLLSLSGCASLDKVFSESTPQVEQSTKTAPSSATVSSDVVPIKVDPMQQRITELRAKPNLYLSGQPPVDASSQSLFEQALQANKDGNPDIAAQLFVTLTQTQPKLSGPWLQLGNLKMQEFADLTSDQFEQKHNLLNEAKVLFEKATDVNQHNYYAHNRLATVLRELGEFAQAERHYHHAIASWPAYDNSYLNLGILYDLYMGKKPQALEYYELYQALQDKPGRQVRGWIADLKRQLTSRAAQEETQ